MARTSGLATLALAAPLAGLLLGATALTPAQALDLGGGLSLTGNLTTASDYRFRGISQTKRNMTLQGTVEVSHDVGVYVSAFASNVAFQNTNARQEVDYAAGWRGEFGAFKIDLGGILYTYPEANKTLNLSYYELAAKASYSFEPVTLLASVFYSPQFQAKSGNAWYVEGGVQVALPLDFTLDGRLGHQSIQRNARFGTPDFTTWSLGISRPMGPVTLSLAYVDTNIKRGQCVGGQDICTATALATLTFPF